MLKNIIVISFIACLSLHSSTANHLLGTFDCKDLDAAQCKQKFTEYFTHYLEYKALQYFEGLSYVIRETLNIESAKPGVSEAFVKELTTDYDAVTEWVHKCNLHERSNMIEFKGHIEQMLAGNKYKYLFEGKEFLEKKAPYHDKTANDIYKIWTYLYSQLRPVDKETYPGYVSVNEKFLEHKNDKRLQPFLRDVYKFLEVDYVF